MYKCKLIGTIEQPYRMALSGINDSFVADLLGGRSVLTIYLSFSHILITSLCMRWPWSNCFSRQWCTYAEYHIRSYPIALEGSDKILLRQVWSQSRWRAAGSLIADRLNDRHSRRTRHAIKSFSADENVSLSRTDSCFCRNPIFVFRRRTTHKYLANLDDSRRFYGIWSNHGIQ